MWSMIRSWPARYPARALFSRYGAFDMLSMPPDKTMLAEPALMMSCASIVAFMPEPQTLLMVVAPVASGNLAPRAAWRAGAWPCPAGSTLPMKISSIRSVPSLARSSAAPITWEPSLWALSGERSPMKRPNGVRAAERMTTGSGVAVIGESPGARELDYNHHMMRCKKCNGTIQPKPGITHEKISRSDELD